MATVLLGFILRGTAQNLVNTLGSLALVVWASLEIIRGQSLFRRLTGGIVLLVTLVRVGMQLAR
jgi:hypothetical protein